MLVKKNEFKNKLDPKTFGLQKSRPPRIGSKKIGQNWVSLTD